MTRLDEVIPRWQFRERHSIRIEAPPEVIFDAVLHVTAREIVLYRTLTWIRRLGRSGPPGILNAPPDEPPLEVATRSGFRRVASDPPREIVVGIDIAPAIFAAMNFRIEGQLLSTETRIFASTPRAKRTFAVYWLVIRGGSGFIRRMWLRAIRKRAEL